MDKICIELVFGFMFLVESSMVLVAFPLLAFLTIRLDSSVCVLEEIWVFTNSFPSCSRNNLLFVSLFPFQFGLISCVPQKTHSQQAMTKVKYVLVPDVK
jgi:hypothetical protein